jgi:hypothetical protein
MSGPSVRREVSALDPDYSPSASDAGGCRPPSRSRRCLILLARPSPVPSGSTSDLGIDRVPNVRLAPPTPFLGISPRNRARGHFPSEQAALKCLYLVIVSLDPTGRGRRRWTNRWKAALNAFDITFDGRLTAARR